MALFDIVFEGGGAKGATFVGALEVLLDRGGHRPRRVIGTSAGAITAAFVAAGFGPQELLATVTEKRDGEPRFSSFMDTPRPEDFPPEERQSSLLGRLFKKIDLPFIPDFVERRLDDVILDQLLRLGRYRQIFSFVERGGLFSGNEFLAWLHEKLGLKGMEPGDTLETFATKTGSDLSLVASDTADGEMLVLNQRTAPEVPVAWAVRMSMSIPFVWQEVIWRREWGSFQGRPKAGNSIVDGGLLSNFPIRLLGHPKAAAARAENRAIMGKATRERAELLGLLIDETLPVQGEPETTPEKGLLKEARTVRRISRMVDTMTGGHDKQAIRDYRGKICHLPAKGFGTLEFDLEGERLEHFLQSGRDAMAEHLETRGLSR